MQNPEYKVTMAQLTTALPIRDKLWNISNEIVNEKYSEVSEIQNYKMSKDA